MDRRRSLVSDGMVVVAAVAMGVTWTRVFGPGTPFLGASMWTRIYIKVSYAQA